MRREPGRLDEGAFDVLVVGAGIYGICTAWDAAQRGLRVALVDRGDFCGETSANSLKIAHGGLRYLQKADLARARASIRERRALLRVAPHLVRPLACLLPTRRRPLVRSRFVLGCGLVLNDVVSWDRNRGLGEASRLPHGRIVPAASFLDDAPGLDASEVTGGALWYDAQIRNSERLAIAWLHKAVDAGTVAVNYFRVDGLLREGGRVVGARGRDLLEDAAREVRAETVVNTCGPWAERLAGAEPSLALALNLVVSREPTSERAMAFGQGSERLFFVVPWRGRSMIGTTYFPYRGDPERCEVRTEHVERFLAEFNEVNPAAALTLADVSFVHAGLLPAASEPSGSDEPLEHPRMERAPGLVGVAGVKWTTARGVAQELVDAVFHDQGRTPQPCRTAETPVRGGERGDLDALVDEARTATGLDEAAARHLVENYGTAYTDVARFLDEAPGVLPGDTPVLAAEIVHAVREEMALTLSDIVFRRTILGTAGSPGAAALADCARRAADLLGWDGARTARELAAVEARFPESQSSKLPTAIAQSD